MTLLKIRYFNNISSRGANAKILLKKGHINCLVYNNLQIEQSTS